MVTRVSVIAFLVLLIVALFACQQQDSGKKKESPKLYQASELALLMRDMDDEYKSVRAQLLDGKLPTDSFSAYLLMHTAKATNPDEISESYFLMATAFSEQVKSMQIITSTEKYISAFNQSVELCISCHTQYCQGPIDRIKKLRIPAAK